MNTISDSALHHASRQTEKGVMREPVLLIMHRLESDPGAVGQYFRARGIPLDIRRPSLGDALPKSMEGHCGAIIFGGRMSANDPDGFVKTEIDWIGVPLAEAKPYLGICLGAQMLAKKLGAEVYRHDEGCIEAGYETVFPTAAGDKLGAWPAKVYQWHREGFTLAAGAVALAGGDVFPNQAFSYGPYAFGVQFHPEITLAMIHRWTVRGAPRLVMPGAQQPAEHMSGHVRYGRELRAWTFRFLDGWLAKAYGERGDVQPLSEAA